MTIKPIIDLSQLIAVCMSTLPNSKEEVENIKHEIMQDVERIRDAYAPLIQINYNTLDAIKLFSNIKRNVASATSVDFLPDGLHTEDIVGGFRIETPTIMSWQKGNSGKNFVISYDKENESKAKTVLNNIVTNILISLPGKSFRLHFIDMTYTGQASFLTQHLDKSIYDDLITEYDKCRILQDELKEKMNDSLEDYGGNLVDYNHNKGKVVVPYDLVVILDYRKSVSNFQEMLSLFENGHKGGIYFVLMNNVSENDEYNGASFLGNDKYYNEIDVKSLPEHSQNCFIGVTPILDDETLAKACFDFINSEATAKPQITHNFDYNRALSNSFATIDKELLIPVGQTNDAQNVDFKLDSVGHNHAFIIGQSGSGKSVLLHDIIMGAITKFSPDELQLYLMDMKVGGVEFNRYRNVKHVKALLVDNTDMQITLEILREINNRMRERGKRFRDGGVSNIIEYNKRNLNSRVPRIIIVIDECHVLFPSIQSSAEIKTYREIMSILTKIAKEGRSQGVHLVFATQTLAQTDIPDEIINNVSDRFLLKCSQNDSERMVEGSSRDTTNLNTGEIFYHEVNKNTIFKSFFMPTSQSAVIIDEVIKKVGENAKEQFYFVGTQTFKFNEKVASELEQNHQTDDILMMVGRTIDTQMKPLKLKLTKDMGENVILFGINDEEQVSRTSIAALRSAIVSNKFNNTRNRIVVINCLSQHQNKANEILHNLESDGHLELLTPRSSGEKLLEIAQEISDGTLEDKGTLLFILGQERFNELRQDVKIAKSDKKDEDSAFTDMTFSSDAGDNFESYKSALEYIIENGPEKGVHVVIQIDKPGNLLFKEFFSVNEFNNMFHHLVMLKSESRISTTLNLDDDIHLENLSSDIDRLRAIYYQVNEMRYTLFSPFGY